MLYITSCGHDSHHPKACDIEHSEGLPDYLLLLVKTEAWFCIDKKRCFTQPNMAILFNRHTYIHYGRSVSNYNDDWIHFNFTENDRFIEQLHSIPLNAPVYPPDFRRLSQYVQMITLEFRSPSPHSAFILDSLMKSLLFSFDAELTKSAEDVQTHKHYAKFSRLRTQLYNSPSDSWSAQYAAALLHLSTSYFQHLYRHFFGCAFQQDVIRARLEQAKFYLSNSTMSIRNLAEFCGYENELHFMRQFKKEEGVTPSQFRKNSSFSILF